MLDKSVEFLLRIFIVVLLSSHSNSDSGRDVSNSLRPDESIEDSVDSDVLGLHFLLGISGDFSDSSWCSLLELDSVTDFMEIDGVISSSFCDFFSLSLSHFN